jgi:hypothetical protein
MEKEDTNIRTYWRTEDKCHTAVFSGRKPLINPNPHLCLRVV